MLRGSVLQMILNKMYATNRLNKFQFPESYYREFCLLTHDYSFYREAGLWNMQSSRLGLRFYKEIRSTNLNAGIYIVSIMKETKPKYYFLIDIYRHFVGEDLDSLSLKELQNLEQQLDSALKHIRSRKVKSFY